MDLRTAVPGEPARAAAGRDPAARSELYRLLAEPTRLRLLGLASAEELGVSELAELLDEGQPKVSRHASALREAGLLDARKQGTWTLLRLAPHAAADPVVADAVAAGRAAALADGSMARIEAVVAARDARAREFFAKTEAAEVSGPPAELAAYLAALAPLVESRALAVDAGTGDGALLEILSPLFERVVALDRSEAQLALAKARARRRGFTNVDFVCGDLDGDELARAVAKAHAPGADVVFASRLLHHAPVPARAMVALAKLVRAPTDEREGGALCVLDYEAHDDEAMRDRQADLWLGFSKAELEAMAKAAGLASVVTRALPQSFSGDGPDRHLTWQVLFARAAKTQTPSTKKTLKRKPT